jgi:Tfp pilus assembly protein PilX
MSINRKLRKRQQGISLIIALFLLLLLSALAALITVATNTEVLATSNYRMMMQSRYAAEAGVQKALNWFTYNYTPASSYASYGTSKNPVVYPATATTAVSLSAVSGTSSNYPDSTVASSFNTALSGKTLTSLGMSAGYNVTARLLRVNNDVLTGNTVETWQIVSTGSTTNGNSSLQLTAELQKAHGTALFTYAAFAQSPACGGFYMDSGVVTDSYTSAGSGTYSSTKTTTGGDIGSNGSINGGSDTIYGNVVSAKIGTGTPCTQGNPGISGAGNSIQSISRVTVPTPVIPPQPLPITSYALSNNQVLAPGNYGNVTSGGGGNTVHLSAGTYNFNSLSTSDGLFFVVDSAPVTINFWGTGVTNVVNTGGPLTINNVAGGGKPSDVLIQYAGTGNFVTNDKFGGSFAMNMPNAAANIDSSDIAIYGAMIFSTLSTRGGITIHYDNNLKNNFNTASVTQLTGYSWSKF